jgi:hypothetical protein
METRAAIKYFHARQGPERKSHHSDRNIRRICTIVCQRQKLEAHFKRGVFHICDVRRPGRPKTVTIPGIIDLIHEIMLEDRQISAKPIAEQLGISRKRVGSIIHEDLDMRKLSVKWVPKCLNADQKRQRCQSSEQNLEYFRRDPNDFLSQLVTMYKTWFYHFDPVTKQQSIEWRHSDSPRPKNSECKNPLEKFSSRFFGIKTASPSLIIFQRAKLSTRSISYLYWCN